MSDSTLNGLALMFALVTSVFVFAGLVVWFFTYWFWTLVIAATWLGLYQEYGRRARRAREAQDAEVVP